MARKKTKRERKGRGNDKGGVLIEIIRRRENHITTAQIRYFRI